MSAASATSAEALSRINLFGTDWYDLRAWAGRQGLRVDWNAQTRVLTLTNRTIRLALGVESRQAVVNGIKVWLTHPITPRNSGWLISVLDTEAVLGPLLKPPRRPGPVRTIVLDPGHGGRDTGYRSGDLEEKRYTLLLAQQLRAKLQAAGYRVVLTRARDTYLELPERPAAANRIKADLFLSLHFNASGNGDPAVRGVEVFCLTPRGAASTHAPRTEVFHDRLPGDAHGPRNLLLAYHVQQALVERLQAPDRGVKHARFAVLRDLTMPGILIEAGFLSSPEDARLIRDARYRDRLAAAIVEGIRRYRRAVEL